MAVEEAKNIEVEPECPSETPVVVEKEEEKAIVPVEPSCVPEEEKPVDDTKALVVVESKLISYPLCVDLLSTLKVNKV